MADDIFDRAAKSSPAKSSGDIFDQASGQSPEIPDAAAQAHQQMMSGKTTGMTSQFAPTPSKTSMFAGTNIPQSPSRIPASMTGDPSQGFNMKDVGVALPATGGTVGGLLGGVPGAALGGIAGEGINQTLQPSANPAAEMLKQGAIQGTFEGGGKLISAAASRLAPAAVKRAAGSLLTGRLNTAGQAIDTYLAQPNLKGVTVDIATPVNQMLDNQIAKASRSGADSLAKRLTELKATWNTNYNLANPTLSQANNFRREIGDITTFAGEANKDSLNKVQRQVVGIVGDEITKAAPGIQPLNDAYANLLATQAAIKQAAKKSTSGYTGTALAAVGGGIGKVGQMAPVAARIAQGYLAPSQTESEQQ